MEQVGGAGDLGIKLGIDAQALIVVPYGCIDSYFESPLDQIEALFQSVFLNLDPLALQEALEVLVDQLIGPPAFRQLRVIQRRIRGRSRHIEAWAAT